MRTMNFNNSGSKEYQGGSEEGETEGRGGTDVTLNKGAGEASTCELSKDIDKHETREWH